jgi:hypothetical protein
VKRFLLILCLFSLIPISGCSSLADSNSTLSGHFSDNPNKFSIFIINNKKSNFDWNAWEQKNKITNVGTIEEEDNSKYNSLKEAKKDNKALNVDKLPYYVVFNSYKMVYQTSNKQSLIKFLHKHKP